ncbi:MAG TPA: NrsF family protein [bacterium]|nr:NrsF family protein [bacterium]
MTRPSSHNQASLSQAQRLLVEKLVAGNRPRRPVPSLWVQWLVWLVFAAGVSAFVLSLIGPQFEIVDRLQEPASGGFLALAFLLSGVCAWMGIASSLPGREPGPIAKTVTLLLVLVLFALPFLFFGQDSLAEVWTTNWSDGWFCARTVVLVAIPSWVLLGFLASGNASFHPGWTGTWLGASSFLLGTGTIQMHCARWQTCHILVDHLLPMLALIFVPIWLGSYWFSRWRK